jgi:quinohemoprotein ethanol dehydrogenase
LSAVNTVGRGLILDVCVSALSAVALFHSEIASTASNDSGEDWPSYGRALDQQHYSPLSQITSKNVRRLGLAWSRDLGPENSATQPIAVDGVLYFATGLSVVNAVDAASGRLLWRYDPKAGEKAGLNLRWAFGVRGIAWSRGKIYTGTADGRLVAIDAKKGTVVWSVQTLDKDFPGQINGAPRVFDGKVIIGFASDIGKNRGYVTTYNAETGEQLWRFYTVPGNPADGFENGAMEMAAKTWTGQWWKFGGGGAVLNSIAYDPETDTVFFGTGNGYPMNHRVRSPGGGDNLFTASILALQGKTGAYKWHYQENPGDTWDYDAFMDIELADLRIEGEVRKVLMQATKNGFFYVIDRVTGELISAQPYAKVTWASHIDVKTGRPVENFAARYPNGIVVKVWPSGFGAHNWMPMAYSPETRLAYIPKIEMGMYFTDKGVDVNNWRPPVDRTLDPAFHTPSSNEMGEKNTTTGVGALVAWNPATQTAVWTVPYPTIYNGGVLATRGGVVFEGTIDGMLKAYAAASGEVLWSFVAEAPLIATPISYSVHGEQYVTVLTGLGMGMMAGAGVDGQAEKYHLDSRSQRRRVLTFKLDGKAKLPPSRFSPLPFVDDPTFKDDADSAKAGQGTFDRHCVLCHGPSAIAVIQAPDLRRSGVVLSRQAFRSIVHDGALESEGMPQFKELTDEQLSELRQYIRTEAQVARAQR